MEYKVKWSSRLEWCRINILNKQGIKADRIVNRKEVKDTGIEIEEYRIHRKLCKATEMK